MQPDIPFSKPYRTGKELTYVTEVIESGKVSSDGRFTRLCAGLLRERLGVHEVFMVPSCTAALELACTLAGLGEGDEVIMPSFTFTSTANAVVRTGARPVFVDVRPDTLNIDESLIEARITPRTRAICPVHYGGVSCEMDAIMDIAQRYNLLVIEDAAQATNAFYGGRPLGSIGHFGAFSFHGSKDYTCGEGGALSVNSPEMAARAEVIREKGTDRSRFLRGEVDKYTWVGVGSSYVPAEIACAYLYAQLESMDHIKCRRRRIYEGYRLALASFEDAGWLRLPRIPEKADSNWHMFYTLARSEAERDALIDWLREDGIHAVFHYVPLHCSPVGSSFGYRKGDLPVCEEMSGRLLRLPFFPDLRQEEQARVIDSIGEFFRAPKGRTAGTVSSNTHG